ncbi:DUF444 family protein [Candidatus Woesearchaeota archaeon]|nr:DUF444 family protein [Candidatus Woesearchaeota archaeon]
MASRIDADNQRYKKKVKQLLHKKLGKYIGSEKMRVSQNGKRVSINIPIIPIPHFEYDRGSVGGVSAGDGEEGDLLFGDQPGDGSGAGDSGFEEGDRVDFSCEELTDLLIEDLRLPKLKPTDSGDITEKRVRYDSISRTGPQSLRHPRRTLKQALKRSIATGTYQPGDPFMPSREDFRYRAPAIEDIPLASALIIDLMDVSGSMDDEKKTIVKTEVFWRDRILERLYQQALGQNYQGIKRRYVVHTADAKEVSEYDFFHLQISGGTKISAGYEKVNSIIDEEKKAGMQNIYVFHYTDGENFDSDQMASIKALQEIIAETNLVGYTQIGSDHQFLNVLRFNFREAFDCGDLVASLIQPDKDPAIGEQILNSIKEKLQQGR